MEGKEVYEKDILREIGDGFWGLWDLQREVEFWSGIVSVRHRGCWRFWARGPGYPYDILELGSYLVGRVELGFGQCFTVQQRSRRQADKRRVISIRPRYYKIMHCF
jgi:hypothetical protein